MTAPPNLVNKGYPILPEVVFARRSHIDGIEIMVYGLEEIPRSVVDVACLWLLHPRLQRQECMTPVASSCLNAWAQHSQHRADARKMGLIAISFDQRNHGTRQVNAKANNAWIEGNETHAEDMYEIYGGTATDTSELIEAYQSILCKMGKRLVLNIVCGISLGGHAVWQCLFNEPNVVAGISIIGCPDYKTLIYDRARLSKRASVVSPSEVSSIPFFASEDFPDSLAKHVQQADPAALIQSIASSSDTNHIPTSPFFTRRPTIEEQKRLVPMLHAKLTHKRILNLSGSIDRLVPYTRCSLPFLSWLKEATAPNGWLGPDLDLSLRDILVEGVGHEMCPAFAEELERFVVETLQRACVVTTPDDQSKSTL